jgi:hypothetical protein
MIEPEEVWNQIHHSSPPLRRLLGVLRTFRRQFFFGNHVRYHMESWLERGWAADVFWARQATRYYPEFRIASVEDALRFAFEVEPRQCYGLNNNTLPFGCHAWGRYDRQFWEPFLLKDTVEAPRMT